MNISGIIVHSRPETVDVVRDQLLTQPGVEVHGISNEGRMVVTVESESNGTMADTVMSFQNMPGVIAAAMVYHHFDDLENDTETESNQKEAS